MFTKEDLEIESIDELLEFLPALPFVGLAIPILLAGYTAGFIMDMLGLFNEPG